MPTANSDWITPSCSSLAIRSRSSISFRRCSWRCASPNSTATDACAANASTRSTCASRRAPPQWDWRQTACRRPRLRAISGMNIVGPMRVNSMSARYARSSSDAFSTTTGFPRLITLPEIEPSRGTTGPSSSVGVPLRPPPRRRANRPSPRRAARPRPSPLRRARASAPPRGRAPPSPPRRRGSAVVTSPSAASQRPRLSASSYSRAFATAMPACAARITRASDPPP